LTYLLDSNACIALINGKPSAVRGKFQKAIESGAEVNVSTVVAFELWYGVAKSQHQEVNAERLDTFLAGRPIGAYDLLIAGQAVRHKVTLVTANEKEFARVQGLIWEDWAKS